MYRPIKFLIVSISLATLTACSGGGGGSSAPSVTFDPANNATGVEPTANVTATFPFDVLGASVDATTVTLNDGSSVAGLVSFDGATNVATFDPDSKLALLREHTIAVTNGITNLSGDPITQAQASFTTRDGAWGTAEKREDDDVKEVSELSVATDADGNAIAVWYQSPNVYASYYTVADDTWSARAQIDLNGGVDLTTGAAHPLVKMDYNGNAIAVWSHYESSVQQIYANHYDKVTGWSDTATKIDAATAGSEWKPQIGFDNENDAVLVWSNSTDDSIRAAHFDSSMDTWGASIALENSANALVPTSYPSPQVSVTDSGDAIVVWTQNNGAQDVIYAAAYTKSNDTWSTPAEISDANDAAEKPRVSIDPSGKAIAVWQQTADSRNSIFYNIFDNGSWATATLLESDDVNSAYYPDIAFSEDGSAIAIWEQRGSGDRMIATRRYTSGTWDTLRTLPRVSTQSIWTPIIRVDALGNAIACWRERDNDPMVDDHMVVSRYTESNDSWSASSSLDTDPDMGSYISCDVSASGYAAALWLKKDTGETEQTLWSSVFK